MPTRYAAMRLGEGLRFRAGPYFEQSEETAMALMLNEAYGKSKFVTKA
jgi:hypothetical protein